MRAPHKVARLLLAFVVCSTIFADYWEYSRAYHLDPNTWMDVVQGTGGAPQQYRIGVVRVADLMRRHGHIGLRHAFTLIDLLCASIAVYLLFALFERSGAYRRAGVAAQWFGAAAFVFLVQYYFAWTTWYQRPETMASAAVMAAMLWLLSVRLPLVIGSAGLVLLAAMQGFIRADVAAIVHVGVLLVCLTRAGDGFALPRWMQAATSVCCVLVAGGVQYYLMHVVYPHASYGSTPVVELVLNVTDWIRLVPFALYMLPWAWLVVMLVKRRAVAEAPGLAVVVGSGIYVVLWWVLGKIDEVRIFLPYAVALIPLTCGCAMLWFVAESVGASTSDGEIV
jgi:hypothetical protein